MSKRIWTMNDTKKMIEDTDLNVDRLENLAKLVVDSWDMDCLLDYAQRCLNDYYKHDPEQAVLDAEDYTLEELDNE